MRKQSPYDALRNRTVTIQFRANPAEVRMLDEVCERLRLERAATLRSLIKQAHADRVTGSFEKQSRTEILAEAARLAVTERVAELRNNLIAEAVAAGRVRKGRKRR